MEATEAVATSERVIGMVSDYGITFVLAVLCIVILITLPLLLIRFGPSIIKTADALHILAESSVQQGRDIKEMKDDMQEGQTKLCQEMATLKATILARREQQ